MTTVPCPYRYKNGKSCTGSIVRVEAYKADVWWVLDQQTGAWSFSVGEPRSHFHLFCSERGNHASKGRPDALKYYYRDLPAELRAIIA